MANKPMTNKEFSDWIESTLEDCIQNTSRIKYTVKKAYSYDRHTGREKVIWNILFGDEVVDACNLRRDAKIWCDKWNKILAEEAASGV